MPVIFLMAFLVMGLALAVLAGTFVYVVCVGIGALSMFVRKHEPEIRCAACTYDILKKGVEKCSRCSAGK